MRVKVAQSIITDTFKWAYTPVAHVMYNCADGVTEFTLVRNFRGVYISRHKIHYIGTLCFPYWYEI